MTFRRRLLVATVTMGGIVLCFQPVMKARMESRLSTLVGAKVEIGSSKISLYDNTIAIRDLKIHRIGGFDQNGEVISSSPTIIPHAALRFNWNGILFRNFKVDNFLASDVRWELANPSTEIIPIADDRDTASILLPKDSSAHLDRNLNAVVQPINLKIAEEATRQSRTQLSVSSRIKSLSQGLLEVMPSDGSFNVLRQPSIVDDTKKDLSIVKQSIAEDRIARRESDKIISAMRQSAQQNLVDSFSSAMETDVAKVKQVAVQLAKTSLAKEWNRNRSVVEATVRCLTALQDPVEASKTTSRNTTTGPDRQVLTRMPVGLTRCVAGKIKGVAQFAELPSVAKDPSSEFVLQFWNLSSREFSAFERPSVSLKLNREPLSEDAAWLVCSARQMVLHQSNATQVQVLLERKQNGGGPSCISIQHASHGWAAAISLPIQSCVELLPTESIGKEYLTKGKSNVVGKLIGTTSSDDSETNVLLIEIEDSSLSGLESILSPAFRVSAEKRLALSSIRGTEKLNDELSKMNTRWGQLGEEHAVMHEKWDSSIAEINEQLQRLEAAFKRTSRSSNLLTTK